MEHRLKDIANIQPGHSFRGRIETVPDGNLSIIQIKDIGTNGSIFWNELVEVNESSIKPEYFVRKGDVLFTTRGTSRRAATVDRNAPRTIFVSQIFALRLSDVFILPEYLAWFINQEIAQQYLDTYSSGSTIQNIRKDVLADMLVNVPDKETQQKILRIDYLRRKERCLENRIRIKRDAFRDQLLLNIAQK